MSLSDFDRLLDQQFGGQPSYTGKLVSETGALAVDTVWACVDALASDIATMPQMTYRRTEEGRERATEHYLWGLLQDQANPEMTAWRYTHLMQTWVGLNGNAYAEIEINGRGQVTALWPWRPDRVKITRQYKGGPLQYTYKMQDGKPFTLPGDRIFHLRGLSVDGVTGLSPIEVHRQRIGLDMAITEHGARYFGNSAEPRGMLTHPQKIDDAAFLRLKKDWAESHQGLDNAYRIAILEEGVTYKETASNMVDAEFIKTAGLTAQAICRIYGVPQHRVGLLDRATNNNIEELSLEYVLYSLNRWTTNWESETHASLLSAREFRTIFTRFNYLNLLRGNHEAMGKWIAILRQWGIMNADEIREGLLDMNAQPDGIGKAYWTPVNMMPEGGNPETAPRDMKIVPTPAPKSKPNGLAH